MEPNKFRESRYAINQLIDDLTTFIEKKELDASKACHKEAIGLIDTLRPKAEGKIQKRSVRNLNMRVHALSTRIKKLKPKKEKATKKKGAGSTVPIVWDEEKVSRLSAGFLGEVFRNMKNDKDAQVCFSTAGKGVRPSYQIVFGNKGITAFSGSGHNPLKRQSPTGMKTVSEPFSHKIIDSILKHQNP